MSEVYLYNQRFYWPGKMKALAKRILNKNFGGPAAVEASLLRGINELAEPYKLNSGTLPKDAVVGVLSGIQTLKWAIRQKQRGQLKKIVAGPNIIVDPHDHNGLIIDPMVDNVVVPSEWVKEFYERISPSLKKKLVIWPAGTAMPNEQLGPKTIDFLVYKKSAASGMASKILDFLQLHNYSYSLIEYGKFNQDEYFRLLGKSRWEIYLSASESQGLALFEAWAREVPTLVWESGKFVKAGVTITGKISAPYLSSQCGDSFYDLNDFENKLEGFVKRSFSPGEFVRNNYTDKICARRYLGILYA